MKNFIRLRQIKDILVADIIGNKINTVEFDMLIKSIRKLKKFTRLFLNISYLSEINNDTINKLRYLSVLINSTEISIINPNPIKNSILNIFEIDKLFKIYMNFQDAKEYKKPVINRKLRLIS